MLEIEIDGNKLTVPNGTTVIEAARANGTYIPHFCYHKKLSIAANCRMCLVQVEKAPKPLPACATPVSDGMKVYTHSDMAVKAQQGVMEFLLINHPLDCPICDQGGECQLQDLAVGYGGTASRYEEEKRVVENKELGPLISTDMTRCIHCTRCVRFTEEIAGLQEIGMANRGEHSEIMSFVGMTVDSEISGNVIDLCPVGALTSKPFRYTARTWELSRRKSISPHDGLGTNIVVQVKNNRVMRVLPLENESINECWISDRDRFSYEALNSEMRLQTPMLKQGGQWIETDWQTALEYIANGINSITSEHGRDSIAVCGTANSTLEELYLLNEISKQVSGEEAIFDLRLADPEIENSKQGVFWLGVSIEKVSSLKSIFLIGSTIRSEMPLLAQRIRQAVKRGGSLSVLHAANDNLNCNVHECIIARPDNWASELAAVVKAAYLQKELPIPDYLQNVDANEQSASIAHSLIEGATELASSVIFLGALVATHPYASKIVALAQALAEVTGATVGFLPIGANSVGAQLLGLKKSREHALEKKAVLLFNSEPELDAQNGAKALSHLKDAEMVVALTAFKHAASEYADVLLPIAPFTETAGSFINIQGVLQSFNGVVKPSGNTRPGWKVLRVLGELLGLSDFTVESVEEVRRKALQNKSIELSLNNELAGVRITLPNDEQPRFIRLGEVPIYQSDAIVRRAPSLQKTKLASYPEALLSLDDGKDLEIQDDDLVTVYSNESSIDIKVRLVGNLARGTIRLQTGHASTWVLGGMFDALNITRKQGANK